MSDMIQNGNNANVGFLDNYKKNPFERDEFNSANNTNIRFGHKGPPEPPRTLDHKEQLDKYKNYQSTLPVIYENDPEISTTTVDFLNKRRNEFIIQDDNITDDNITDDLNIGKLMQRKTLEKLTEERRSERFKDIIIDPNPPPINSYYDMFRSSDDDIDDSDSDDGEQTDDTENTENTENTDSSIISGMSQYSVINDQKHI